MGAKKQIIREDIDLLNSTVRADSQLRYHRPLYTSLSSNWRIPQRTNNVPNANVR